MVDPKDNAIVILQNAISQMGKVDNFADKLYVMNTLLDLEWSLQDKTIDELPEELENGHESPWEG